MFDKLLGIFKCFGTVAIGLLVAEAVQANPTEYVFSAPPEVDYDLVEIPASEEEYPLYECSSTEQTSSEKVDSHACDNLNQDPETHNSKAQDSGTQDSDPQLTSQSQQNDE